VYYFTVLFYVQKITNNNFTFALHALSCTCDLGGYPSSIYLYEDDCLLKMSCHEV